MSDLHSQSYRIKIKQGLLANLDDEDSALLGIEGEPAYATDTQQFFIHNGTRFKPPNFGMLISYDNEQVFYQNDAVIYY